MVQQFHFFTVDFLATYMLDGVGTVTTELLAPGTSHILLGKDRIGAGWRVRHASWSISK